MSQPPKTKVKADEALLQAARKGDLKTVKDCIAAGVDVNAAGKGDAPAIFAAVASGKLEVVEALLAANASVNCVAYPTSGSGVKSTPLCFAIEKGNWEIAQELMKAGANPALEPYEGENAAGFAAQQADKSYRCAKADYERWMQFIRDAIKQGVKVRDYWLWDAVNSRHVELALLLISAGVNPNAAPFNTSVLVRAIEFDLEEIAIALIKVGADVKTPAEITPLLMAAKMERISLVPALLDAGADINAAGDIVIGESGKPEIEKRAEGNLVSITAHLALPPVAEGATALVIATRLGNTALAKLLIERGANLNIGDKHGRTALSWALELEKQDIVGLLRKAGAQEPEFLEGSLTTALWSAAKSGDAAKVEMLLKRGANADEPVKDREGKHLALVSAAREGRFDVVQMLLLHKANVNLGASENWTAGITPLMAAARRGHVEVLKTLLAAGADLEAKDAGFEEGGETALHYAARGGHVAAINALLDAGAKINTKAKGGITPLLVAVSKKQAEAAKALLDRGANPNVGPSDGSGPLNLAAGESDLEMVKLLLEHGATPLPRGKKPVFLPLNSAAYEGAIEIVTLLLKAGAPVNGQDITGSTALEVAALRGHKDIVVELLRAGANPNLVNRDGFTALMAAARARNELIVQLLLDAGADASAVTSDGRTALKIAQEEKNQKIISLIESALAKMPQAAISRMQSAERIAAKAASDEIGDEEDFEPPDFSEAAASPSFQATLSEVEKLCGSARESLNDIEGGFSFAVKSSEAEKLLAEHHQRLLQKGAYLLRHQRDSNGKEALALLPTRDWADVIRAFQTNGANYDLAPEDIIKWLQKLSAKQPFVITGVSWDWLEGRFLEPVKESRKLANQMYKFCPDIVDQGVGSVKELAQSLEKDGRFFFWWD